VKKTEAVSPPFGWRASPALIDEDFRGCGVPLTRPRAAASLRHVDLTTRHHAHIIGDRNDEGQDCLIAS